MSNDDWKKIAAMAGKVSAVAGVVAVLARFFGSL
jgi:hypothetical protein